MTDTAELIARLKPAWVIDEPVGEAVSIMRSFGGLDAVVDALNRFIVANNALKTEAADALSSLVRERDEALTRWKCFHCHQVFTNYHAAQVHFGKASTDDPECLRELGRLGPYLLEKSRALRAAEARATAAEADAARMRETLEQARHELWNLGLVIGQIAKWPRPYFNRVYIEEWVIRTAKIFEGWGERERADEILAVTSSHTKTNERLEAARNAIGGKDE